VFKFPDLSFGCGGNDREEGPRALVLEEEHALHVLGVRAVLCLRAVYHLHPEKALVVNVLIFVYQYTW